MLIVSENNACSYLVEIIHLFLRRGLNARRKRSTFPFKWLVLVYHCRKFPRVNLPQSLYAFSARYQRDTNNLQLARNDKWTKLIASWHPFITSHPETHKTVSRSATLDKKFIVASWTNQRFILIPRKASFAGNQCSPYPHLSSSILFRFFTPELSVWKRKLNLILSPGIEIYLRKLRMTS